MVDLLMFGLAVVVFPGTPVSCPISPSGPIPFICTNANNNVEFSQINNYYTRMDIRASVSDGKIKAHFKEDPELSRVRPE